MSEQRPFNSSEIRRNVATLRNAMHGKPCPRCYTPMQGHGKTFSCINRVCSRFGVEVKP